MSPPGARMDWANQKDDRRIKGKLIKRTNGGVRVNQKDDRRDEHQSETVTEIIHPDERRNGDEVMRE